MITMLQIDDARHALGVERETFRSLRDHHLGVVDAIERVKRAEERVEELLRQWWAQGCVEAEPTPDYWKMHAVANRIDAKMFAKAADSEREGQRIALAALKEAEAKIRETPCVVDEHLHLEALPEKIAAFIREVWGEKNLHDSWERTMRVLEEAIEFAQANGITEPLVKILVSRVYDREPGIPSKEAGDVGITLLAYCYSQGVTLYELMERNHDAKIDLKNRDVAKLRAKQREKFLAGVGIDVEEM